MIRLHVDVIGLQRLPLAPAIRAEMVADVARAARQAVRDSLQAMIDRTQSQGLSHSARSAWIETSSVVVSPSWLVVALRKECVD